MINLNKFFSFSHTDCSIEKDGKFCVTIDKSRADFYGFDKELVTHKVTFSSVLNNNSGQFDVELDGYFLQCFYHDNPTPNNHLLVGLNGARLFSQRQEDPNNERPNFKRWSYYPLNNGCYLNIDDPMFKKHPELLLGWYYGTKEQTALSPVIKIVKEIARVKEIANSNITFFSSSGGGYACILSSIMVPGSLSISINPQLYIQNYPYAESFTKITGIDLKQQDPLLRNNLAENIKVNSKSKHLIIVNTECYKDMKDHLIPFSKEMGIDVRYGLTIKNNVLIWCYQACGSTVKSDPHISYETKYIYAVIDYIAEQFQNSNLNEKTVELYQPLALLTNEFWYEYYKMRFNYSELQNIKNQNKIVYLNDTKHKIANELLCRYVDITVEANLFNFNCWRVPILQKNSIYSIVISGIEVTTDQETVTIALYDILSKKRIAKKSVNCKQEKEAFFNFITNELDREIQLHIYCGEASKTQNIGLNISKVEIFCDINTASYCDK